MLLHLSCKHIIAVCDISGFPVFPAQPAVFFSEEFCGITAETETVTRQLAND